MGRVAPTDVFNQAGFAARFEWGEAGIRRLGPSLDVLVLVDVLSFTTAVEVAVARRASVYPFQASDATAVAFAEQVGAVLAVDRRHASAERPYSLSPASLAAIPAGARLVLPSPNGSTLSVRAADQYPNLLAGCLRNARAVADAARKLGRSVGVIAAGERSADGTLRFAIEDVLGAGAILRHFPWRSRSPEAEVAVAAFESLASDLPRLVRDGVSGRELAALGFAEDVRLAAQLDVSRAVPRFHNGAYHAASR